MTAKRVLLTPGRCVAAVAVAVLGLALGGAGVAGAAPGQAPSSRQITLRTLPSLPGVRLTVGAQSLVTGPDGTVAATVDRALDLEAGVAPVDRQVAVSETVRARPDRVFVQRDEVVVTFNFDFLTTFSFLHLAEEVAPSTIGKMLVKSSVGAVIDVPQGQPTWLHGSRVTRDSTGLNSKDIYYTVERVEVGGLNVVNANQQRISPRLSQHLAIKLLFFKIDIKARDAFFGFPVGRSITVKYPSGRIDQRDLSDAGTVQLEKLPRGEYQVVVRGGGLQVPHPIAVSRDQPVDLKVFSFFDLALVASISIVVFVSLLWFSVKRRLRLRRARGATEQRGSWSTSAAEAQG